jgi:ArsR family metal-binding transcriptional regulator
MMRAALTALAIATAALPASGQSMSERLNDYPTEVRADYVFGCMAANGQSREVLSKCACSIDVIASILPYDKYVQAETVLSLQQGSGEQLAMFKSAVVPRTMVADLRRAQAEAEMVCF